jgi:hypothetical protein
VAVAAPWSCTAKTTGLLLLLLVQLMLLLLLFRRCRRFIESNGAYQFTKLAAASSNEAIVPQSVLREQLHDDFLPLPPGTQLHDEQLIELRVVPSIPAQQASHFHFGVELQGRVDRLTPQQRTGTQLRTAQQL